MGPIGPGWDYMKGARRELLDAGVHVMVVDATKGSKIPEQVASLLLSKNKAPPDAIIMLGWGAGGTDIEEEFATNSTFREAAKSWCRAGGRFIVQGERVGMFGDWPMWFDKAWKNGEYVRTDHRCFAAGPDAVHWWNEYANAKGAVTSTYNVKACMITDVEPADVLFGTADNAASYSLVPSMQGRSIGSGQVAIAVSQYGEGTVSFFGDVNFEDETLQIMAIVARGS